MLKLMTPTLLSDNLRGILRTVAPLLRQLTEAELSRKASPEKWSAKEVLGHLIDSAYNNHRRFLRALDQEDLIFTGYDQEAWVMLNGYQDREGSDVIDTFLLVQQHLASLLSRLPAERVNALTTRHEFHRMAMRKVAENTPSSLGFLIEDYLFHLVHHLRQIFPDFQATWYAGYQEEADKFRLP
jgi:hypothetical protein